MSLNKFNISLACVRPMINLMIIAKRDLTLTLKFSSSHSNFKYIKKKRSNNSIPALSNNETLSRNVTNVFKRYSSLVEDWTWDLETQNRRFCHLAIVTP